MDTVKIHTTTDKMHEFSNVYNYVVVDNTDGDMRHVAFASTLDKAREMRDTYCEDVFGLDAWESEEAAYVFIEKYNLDCLVNF